MSTSAANAVRQYWGAQLDLLRTMPEDVRARQPEAIHDLRAAGRRTKATVRTFKPLVARKLAKNILEHLDWYNAVLGHARDAEVIEQAVGEVLDERPGARAVMAALDAEKRRTMHIANNMLTSARGDIVLDLVEDLAADPWRKEKGPGRGALLRRARWSEQRVATVWRDGPRSGESVDVWLHRLRRRAKAARYAYESLNLVTDDADVVADSYARLSTCLGIIQDGVLVNRTLSAWPDQVVGDAVAHREELSRAARSELPKLVHQAVPADLIGKRVKSPIAL